MLTLTRRENEGVTIRFGNNKVHLIISHVHSHYKQVRISFESGEGIEILRDELINNTLDNQQHQKIIKRMGGHPRYRSSAKKQQ